MSYMIVCDGCNARCITSYGEDGYPKPPVGWHEFELIDWKAHACSMKCWDHVKTMQTDDPTPTTGHGIAL